MAARQRDVHRVLDQVVELDAAVEAIPFGLGEVVELEHDRHLELSGAQHLDRVLGLLLDEGQLDVGVALREAGDRRRQHGCPGGGERGEPDPAAAHAGDGVELGLGGGEPREHDLGVIDQRAAGVGEEDAPAGAVDERGAGRLLERGDLLGDGGLRVRERLGGRGEGAVLGHRLEHPQLLDIEHNHSLSKPAEVRI